jgi:hypothetical protein
MEQQTLSGKTIRALMRSNKKTIRGLAAQWNITQKRVRFVRTHGVQGEVLVWEWRDVLIKQ